QRRVLRRRHVRVERALLDNVTDAPEGVTAGVSGHDDAIHEDLAGVRREQPEDQAEDGGLTGPTGAEKDPRRARLERQGDVIYGHAGAERLGDVAESDHTCAAPPLPGRATSR